MLIWCINLFFGQFSPAPTDNLLLNKWYQAGAHLWTDNWLWSDEMNQLHYFWLFWVATGFWFSREASDEISRKWSSRMMRETSACGSSTVKHLTHCQQSESSSVPCCRRGGCIRLCQFSYFFYYWYFQVIYLWGKKNDLTLLSYH